MAYFDSGVQWSMSTGKFGEIGNEILKCGLPWKQYVAIATKNVNNLVKFGCLDRIWHLLLEANLCYSASNPLITAPREGQGPSI